MHEDARRALLVATSCLLVSGSAGASELSLFGAGTAGLSLAGANVAQVDDGNAAFTSPAGLAFGKAARFEAGPVVAFSGLKAAGQRVPIKSPVSLSAAADATVPFTGPLQDRVRIGLALHALPTSVLRVLVSGEQTPQMPYYENRTQRLVVMPALAIRLASFIAVGASVDALAGLEGNADVRPGASRSAEPRVDQRVASSMRPVLGLRVDPLDMLHLSLVYRGQFAVAVSVHSDAEIGGVPLTVQVGRSQVLFDPRQLALGAAVDLGARTTVELDATHLRWSAYEGPFFDVSASLPGVGASSPPTNLAFRDTFTVRASASQRVDLGESQLRVRLGGGYEPTMLEATRQGATNVVDASKIVAATGASLRVPGLLQTAAMSFSLGIQMHVLPTRSLPDKVPCTSIPCGADTVPGPDGKQPSAGISNPGYPSLSGGGVAGAVSLSVGGEL